MSGATIAVIVSVSVLAIVVIGVLVFRCVYLSRADAASSRRMEEAGLLGGTEMAAPASEPPYRVQRKLGDGTYGTVYLARRTEDGKMCAVKVVPCSKEKQAEEALNEYMMCLQVQGQPNIVKLLDLFQDTPVNERDRGKSTTTLRKLKGVTVPKGNSTVVCLVTEYYSRGTLFDLLVRHRQNSTTRGLPEARVWDYTKQLLLGLEFMHRNNVVHRDVKPSNVLVSEDDARLALTDFGLSKEVVAGEYVKTRIGTYHYMAPEQMHGSKYNAKADVWAVGCLIYAMCTCKVSTRDAVVMFTVRKSPDFEKRFRGELKTRYSEDLIGFMLSLLVEKASERPTSRQALEMLEAAQNGGGGDHLPAEGAATASASSKARRAGGGSSASSAYAARSDDEDGAAAMAVSAAAPE